MLPLVKFALNNTVHTPTVFTSSYVNGFTKPRVPLTLPIRSAGLDGKDMKIGSILLVLPLFTNK